LDSTRRERQITEVLYRLGEASVADVRAAMNDAPSYSGVRALLSLLVKKGVATTRQEGKRYLYRPARSKKKVARSAMKKLIETFFDSAPVDAVAALLDGFEHRLSVEDLQRVRRLLEEAEAAGTADPEQS